MKPWLRSVLIAAIALTPLNGLLALTSFADISSVEHEAPQKAKSSLTASAKLANDFVFDLKVQNGILPPPIF
ncbi:MAG: hypothetical protein KME15_09355 [Drouetiella hepatica Uher 2000/2452]|jgi:hypothetical protein|uniref:Uncharacterized protein n=1 Tax=Drouetiella hepatica Uher 2000/2452 TaxID=904376 RepID=A0A951QAI5_9CYAN|nr:hypothetical protein [Drouetiella hepatica Uher 2000/2452]